MQELVDLYRAIKTGRYELPCGRVELLLAPGYHETCFQGSGILRAIPSRGIEVVMVGKAIDRCLVDLWPYGEGDQEWNWYQLRAWDCEGREWVGSECVRPQIGSDFGRALGGREVVLRCMLNSVVTHEIGSFFGLDGDDEHYEFIVPSVGQVWWSGWKRSETEGGPEGKTVESRACFHQCEVEGSRVVVEQGEEVDSVVVRVSPIEGEELSPFVDVQVLQSLQLLTARILDFGIQFRRGKHQKYLRLVGPVLRPAATKMPPPYQMEVNSKHNHYWDVFESFLGFLLRQELNPFFHPFMDTLLLIMDASTRSWESYSLMLAVGVEAVLPDCARSDKDGSDESISDAEFARLREHLDSFTGDERAKNRVLGFLPRLREWGATDRLRKLQRLGAIERDDIRAWQRLRNPAAHGDRRRSQAAISRSLDARVLTMFYKIILGEAGYSGIINSGG